MLIFIIIFLILALIFKDKDVKTDNRLPEDYPFEETLQDIENA